MGKACGGRAGRRRLAACLVAGALAAVAACAAEPGNPSAPAAAAGGTEAIPAGFTSFSTEYVRLAHPAGYAVGTPEPRPNERIRTVVTGPELSPGLTPKILVDEAPVNPVDPEFAAEANIKLFRVRGGKVVSQRDVDVPGADGRAIEVEITAVEFLPDGTTLDIRTIELFLTTPGGVGVTVSVLAAAGDFDAAQLRAVIPTVQVLP